MKLNFGILVFALCAGAPGVSPAAEFLLFDGQMAYEDSRNAFYWFGVPDSSPANWTAPDDYAQGQWHARYEIVDQPSYATYGQATGLQSCIWQDGKGGDYPETCGSVHYLDGPGSVEYTEEYPADWWEKADSQASAAPFDWTRGNDFVDMGSPTWHQNDGGGRCLATIADWGGCEENMDIHLPMTIRISIVVVSNGATFSGWESYGFGTGDEDGGSDGAADGDAGPAQDADGGPADDGDSDPVDDGDADPVDDGDSDPVDDGDSDPSLDGGGDEMSDGQADQDQQDAGTAGDEDQVPALDGGCQCDSNRPVAGVVSLLLVVALWFTRRRGRSNRS